MEVLVGGMMENPRWMADLDLRNTYLQKWSFFHLWQKHSKKWWRENRCSRTKWGAPLELLDFGVPLGFCFGHPPCPKSDLPLPKKIFGWNESYGGVKFWDPLTARWEPSEVIHHSFVEAKLLQRTWLPNRDKAQPLGAIPVIFWWGNWNALYIYYIYIYMYTCVYLFNSIYILSFILYLLGTMVPFPVHLPLHPSNERSVYLRALIVERAQDSGSTSLESTQQKWLDNQLGFNTICGLDLSAWGSSKTGADPKLLCICIIIIISYNMLWYLMSTYILWYFIIMMPHF